MRRAYLSQAGIFRKIKFIDMIIADGPALITALHSFVTAMKGFKKLYK